jgi:hypothetical protein
LTGRGAAAALTPHTKVAVADRWQIGSFLSMGLIKSWIPYFFLITAHGCLSFHLQKKRKLNQFKFLPAKIYPKRANTTITFCKIKFIFTICMYFYNKIKY